MDDNIPSLHNKYGYHLKKNNKYFLKLLKKYSLLIENGEKININAANFELNECLNLFLKIAENNNNNYDNWFDENFYNDTITYENNIKKYDNDYNNFINNDCIFFNK